MTIQRIKTVIFPDGRMDTKNAAKYMGRSVKSLAMYRVSGEGPLFVKSQNRVFYYKKDLDNWLNSRGKSLVIAIPNKTKKKD